MRIHPSICSAFVSDQTTEAMEFPDPYASLRDRKLVVLGIPFDVETEELKYYMGKFGELEDCIIMKDRLTGQSRGFGYVTFVTAEDAKKATAAQHVINGRTLDVKVATPKDEMTQSASRKGNRIFIARIPLHVTEGMFRSYFQKYGIIVDAYMPKDVSSRMHRGIGFVTFENAESVDKIMNETHELGGSIVAVDRATPKDETPKVWGGKSFSEQSNKSFSEQWMKDLPEQWAKITPEQWSKYIPEEWAKAFPDQFSFFMAAAAAAAQMGAFGGMEGFDFSAYGFPSETSTEKAENAWTTSDGDAVKDRKSPGSGATTQSPSRSAYSLQENQPANAAQVASNAATSYEGSVQNNTPTAYAAAVPSAANSNSYYPEAGYGMYSMSNFEGAYGSMAHATNMPPNYGFSTPQNGMAASSSGTVYGAHTLSNSTSRYYSGTVPNQAYRAEYASGATYSGPGYGNSCGSLPGTLSGSRYGSGNPYAGPVPIPPNVDYAPRVSYPSAPVGGYGQSESYGNKVQSGHRGLPVPSLGNKVFIGKLPHEATAEHLRTYFSSFGRILDVYVPKDAKKTGHRGFGFVTFFDEGVAERVAMGSHEILGHPVAVDRPTPQDGGANVPGSRMSAGAWGGSVQRIGYGGSGHDHYAGGMTQYGQSTSYETAGTSRTSRTDSRYRPY